LSRLPLRVRLTAAFAVAMAVVLILAGSFAYFRVRSDLDSGIDDSLDARAAAVSALVAQSDTGLSQARPNGDLENFAQVLTPSGHVFDASPGAEQPALSRSQLQDASSGSIRFDRSEALGTDGPVRILATPVHAQGRDLIVVVGAETEDRNNALTELRQAFLIGAPIGVLLAAGIGYLLATLALAPVERMRRRAETITLDRGEQRLPLPPASDEIRRLGETLNAMLDRLDESFRRERRFVAEASHELRTPITVLKSELEVALRTSKLPPDELRAVRSALEEADRLARLAEDLLILARADEGRLPVRRERTDIAELIDRATRPFEPGAEKLGREISIDAAGDLQASLDPLRVEQALRNLIDNSLRHGAGTVRVSAAAQDGALVLTVTDEGSGFGPEDRGHAFERFARGREERAGTGTGLGLAIVRAIAEAHGGTAEIVASDGSRGAVIQLVIPFHDHFIQAG
jgi:two-component system, OmpR family, sensor kinase